MKVIICAAIFTALLFMQANSYAQYYDPNAPKTSNSKPPGAKAVWDWKKVYPGGNAGLGFSNGFYLQLSPLAGYWVTNWFTPGIMLTYIYYSYNSQSYSFRSHVGGISPFARAFILKWLFAHVETGFFYGNALIEDNSGLFYTEGSKFLVSPMVGGGVNFPIGERGGFTVMLLFNLNYKSNIIMPGVNQPYTVRVGFFF